MASAEAKEKAEASFAEVTANPGRFEQLATAHSARSPKEQGGSLADYLGLTKETVSRVFSSFRRDRLIRLRAADEVEIVNRLGLEHLAEWAA